MKLESTVFLNGDMIPSEYTCDGAGINPPLDFVEVPEHAKSLVLIMDDPDVPKDIKPDGMFDHWVVFNIPPKTTGIESGMTFTGAAYGSNSSGQHAYTPPCPPDREHRYFFKLFALDTQLPLKAGATKAQVLEAMENHILSQAELIGRYNRGK